LVRSLRALSEASDIEKVREELGVRHASMGSLSEAARVGTEQKNVSVRRIAFLTVMVQWPLKGGHHHGPRQVARSAQRRTVASVDPTVAAQWAECPGFLWPPRPRRAELLRLASAVATAAGPRPIRAGASRPGRGTGRC